MNTFAGILKNSFYNILGQAIPVTAAVIVMPTLAHRLGLPRLGVVTIAWMLIGYFSLFDFGLGRAITALVAEKETLNRREDVPAMIWTSIAMMAGFGIVAMMILLVSADWISFRLKIPPELRSETAGALHAIAFAMPFVVTSTGWIGALSAYSRFDIINGVRIPLGVVNYLGPLLVLPFTNHLGPVMATLVVARIISSVAFFAVCVHALPHLKKFEIDWRQVRRLLSFGGWMTVSNLISPIMVNFDRFLIGAYISVTAVALYTTPYEAVNRLWVVGGGIAAALFPEFMKAYCTDVPASRSLLFRAVDTVFVALFPVIWIIVVWAYELMMKWLGADFAIHSSPVLQLLAVGVLANSIAAIPFAFIQGIGRPDITAKIHIAELPVYVGMVCFLTWKFGIVGTAVAWIARVSIDMLALFVCSSRLLKHTFDLRRLATFLAGSVAAGLVSKCPTVLRVCASIVVVALFAALLARQLLATRQAVGGNA